MATNLRAKSGYMGSFGRAAFRNGLKYLHSDFKMFNGNILSTSCVRLMMHLCVCVCVSAL